MQVDDMRRSEVGDVQIGEVNDSEEDGRRDVEEPQAERLFANMGGTISDHGAGTANSVVYHMVNAAELAAEGQVSDQGGNVMYQFQTPNLQALEPIPPDQLRNVNFVTSQPFIATGREEKARKESREEEESEEEERGEKEKRSEAKDKEKRRWEEKSKRMEKQLQEQRLLCSRQKAQAEARNAANKRPKSWEDSRNREQDPESGDEERPTSLNRQQRQSSQTTWMPPDRRPLQPADMPRQQPWPPQNPGMWNNPQPNMPPSNWQYGGQWQQPPAQGTWIWKDQAEGKRAAAKKKSSRYETSDESEDSDDDLDAKEKRRKRKEKEKSWEKETPKQRDTRHKKYEKMADTADSDKQSIKHQVAAMYKSVIAQEKVIKHLKSLVYAGSSEDQSQENKDLVDELKAARKDLVERITYLEVAYDYDWEAAKVFREMREANPSSIVLKAVTEAKKRKAASKGGGKETEEVRKPKKKPDANNKSHVSGSGNSGGWRTAYQPHYNVAPAHYWGQPGGYPPAASFYPQQPTYPPAAPYNRQAGSYRPPRPPGCFSCGEANHGFRRCPNAPQPAPAAMAKPPPPPPNT